MAKFVVLLGALSLLGSGFAAELKPMIADALKNVRVLAVPASARPVHRTVAEEFRRDLAPQAEIKAAGHGARPKSVHQVLI